MHCRRESKPVHTAVQWPWHLQPPLAGPRSSNHSPSLAIATAAQHLMPCQPCHDDTQKIRPAVAHVIDQHVPVVIDSTARQPALPQSRNSGIRSSWEICQADRPDQASHERSSAEAIASWPCLCNARLIPLQSAYRDAEARHRKPFSRDEYLLLTSTKH